MRGRCAKNRLAHQRKGALRSAGDAQLHPTGLARPLHVEEPSASECSSATVSALATRLVDAGQGELGAMARGDAKQNNLRAMRLVLILHGFWTEDTLKNKLINRMHPLWKIRVRGPLSGS